MPMYFLIGGWGYEGRVYATLKFFLYTMLGSALMLVGILALVFLNQKETGVLTFDLVTLAQTQALASTTAIWIFLAFAASFAIKCPIFPFHTWLPDAHTQAPTGGSVILAGVLLKLGTYGFLRFGLYLFPSAAFDLAPWFLTLGVIGIIYGALVATMQKDLKRLVAYSSVAHLGFVVIGIFGLSIQGLQGGVLQMVNHGISTGALFLLVGMIYERRHTRLISEMGGIQKVAPVFAGVFMIVMLSSLGLPGLNGFVGEFLVLIGTFVTRRWWAVVATAGVILAAIYLLWAYQRVFHGRPEGANATFPEMTMRERVIMVPLVVPDRRHGRVPEAGPRPGGPAVARPRRPRRGALRSSVSPRSRPAVPPGPGAHAATSRDTRSRARAPASRRRVGTPGPRADPHRRRPRPAHPRHVPARPGHRRLLRPLHRRRRRGRHRQRGDALAGRHRRRRGGSAWPSATPSSSTGSRSSSRSPSCSALVLGALLSSDYLRREDLPGAAFYVLMMLSAAAGCSWPRPTT